MSYFLIDTISASTYLLVSGLLIDLLAGIAFESAVKIGLVYVPVLILTGGLYGVTRQV